MAASWPPTSGAMRISVVRTTPTMGGVGCRAPQPISAGAGRDQDEAERDDAVTVRG